MTQTSIHHRHFVAAPLLVLLLLAVATVDSLVARAMSFGAGIEKQVMQSEESERSFSLPSGGAGVLAPKSRISLINGGSSLEFLHGSALLRTTGRMTIDAGPTLHANVLLGSVSVFRDDSSATVVALDAPVIVTIAGYRYILPAGYQLHITDGTLPVRLQVPDDWLLAEVSRADALPVSPANAAAEGLSSVLQGTDTLTAESLGRISNLSDSSLSLLAWLHVTLQTSRLDVSGAETLSSALAAGSFPDAEWVFAVPALAGSSLKPLPAFLVTQWKTAVIRFASADAEGARTALQIASADDLPSRYEDAGYPKQAQLWEDALGDIHAVLAQLLPDQPLSSSVSSAAAAVPQEPRISLSSEQLRIQSRELLDTHGVLFTAATKIEVDSLRLDCARITSVFIAEDSHDVSYDFSYCPVQNIISGILRNGIALANDVPVEKFFQ